MKKIVSLLLVILLLCSCSVPEPVNCELVTVSYYENTGVVEYTYIDEAGESHTESTLLEDVRVYHNNGVMVSYVATQLYMDLESYNTLINTGRWD